MRRFVLGVLLFIGLNCASKSGENIDAFFWLWLYKTGEETSYKECGGNSWKNPHEFVDKKGDVKIGAYQMVTGDVGFLDLTGGKIEKTDDFLYMDMEVASLPESVPINQVDQDPIPEYEWTYRFEKDENRYTIGIIHSPEGLKSSQNTKDFPVLVLKNNSNIGACSPLGVQSNVYKFSCDLNALPELKEIDESYTFNVILRYRTNNAVFKDCY